MNQDIHSTEPQGSTTINGAQVSAPQLASSFFKRHQSPIWNRLLAAMIDVPLIAVIGAVLAQALGNVDLDPLFGPAIVALLATLLYHTVMEASPAHATLGKRLLGLKTIRLDGGDLTPVDALLRSTTRIIGFIFAMFPHLVSIFLPQRPMLHDLLTRTRTVHYREIPGYELAELQALPKTKPTLLQKGIAAVAYVLVIAAIGSFSSLLQTAGMIRTKISEVYDDLRPTMKAIEAYHNKNGEYPATLSDAGTRIDLRQASPFEAIYAPEIGSLAVRFRPEVAQLGAMSLTPIPGLVPNKPKDITWVCAGTKGFLNSYLPKDCTSEASLAFQKILNSQRNR